MVKESKEKLKYSEIDGVKTRRMIKGCRRTGPTTSNCGPPTKKTQGRITNYLVKISCTRNATNANGKRSLDVDMESDAMMCENNGNVDVVPEPDAKKMNFDQTANTRTKGYAKSSRRKIQLRKCKKKTKLGMNGNQLISNYFKIGVGVPMGLQQTT